MRVLRAERRVHGSVHKLGEGQIRGEMAVWIVIGGGEG